MYRSPVKTRSKKGTESDKSVSKDKVESPLSVSPTPTIDKTSDMEAAVESCVGKHLAKDDVFDNLSEKLIGRIERIVEDAVAKALKGYIDQVVALNKKVAALEEKLIVAEELKVRHDDLEQYQRRNNIRVFGIPESEGEDTDTLVVRLFSEKLGVDVDVDRLDRSHRVGRRLDAPQDGEIRHRPMIVRFTSYRDRRRVFSAKKKLKGSGITIREDLTSARQDLLRRATELFGRGKTWTTDGRIVWLDGNGRRGSATRVSDLPQ